MTPQALVYAAGLGSRLRPLTDQWPKALAPIYGKPALEWILRRLEQNGLLRVTVNTHAHAEQIHRFIQERPTSQLQVQISHEPMLLDTGGGLRKTHPHWSPSESILLHNVDVFSTADLSQAWDCHTQQRPLATLLVQQRPTHNRLLIDELGLLCGVHYVQRQDYRVLRDPQGELKEVGFCGIHLVSPEIFSVLPEQEAAFGIVPVYLERVACGDRIQTVEIGSAYWRDIGTLDSLQQLEQDWERVPSLAALHRGGSPHSISARS